MPPQTITRFPDHLPKYRTAKICTAPMLKLLEICLSPLQSRASRLQQPIFVAFDIDCFSDSGRTNQLGISVLDTLNIPAVDNLGNGDVAQLILSFCFCTAKVKLHRKRNTSHAILKRDRVFLYGVPEFVEHKELFVIMESS